MTCVGKKLADVLPYGPDRVVVSIDGRAVPPKRAREEYGITPDVIYIRGDGWALGAPHYLRYIAHGLWLDEWVGGVMRPDTIIRPLIIYSTKGKALM